MPTTYTVTDPATGQKVKLIGDTPPTAEELNEIFSKIRKDTTVVKETESRKIYIPPTLEQEQAAKLNPQNHHWTRPRWRGRR